MSAVANFFSSVGDLLVSLGQWFIDTLLDLWYAISMMIDFSLMLPQVFAWLPASAVLVMTMTFAIVVIYKILGREG